MTKIISSVPSVSLTELYFCLTERHILLEGYWNYVCKIEKVDRWTLETFSQFQALLIISVSSSWIILNIFKC